MKQKVNKVSAANIIGHVIGWLMIALLGVSVVWFVKMVEPKKQNPIKKDSLKVGQRPVYEVGRTFVVEGREVKL